MILGAMLGSLMVSGCSEGDPIPASKGGAEAREAIEYPLGRPPESKHAKAKKAVTPAKSALPPGTVIH